LIHGVTPYKSYFLNPIVIYISNGYINFLEYEIVTPISQVFTNPSHKVYLHDPISLGLRWLLFKLILTTPCDALVDMYMEGLKIFLDPD